MAFVRPVYSPLCKYDKQLYLKYLDTVAAYNGAVFGSYGRNGGGQSPRPHCDFGRGVGGGGVGLPGGATSDAPEDQGHLAADVPNGTRRGVASGSTGSPGEHSSGKTAGTACLSAGSGVSGLAHGGDGVPVAASDLSSRLLSLRPGVGIRGPNWARNNEKRKRKKSQQRSHTKEVVVDPVEQELAETWRSRRVVENKLAKARAEKALKKLSDDVATPSLPGLGPKTGPVGPYDRYIEPSRNHHPRTGAQLGGHQRWIPKYPPGLTTDMIRTTHGLDSYKKPGSETVVEREIREAKERVWNLPVPEPDWERDDDALYGAG